MTPRELYVAARALELADGRTLEEFLRALRVALSLHYDADGVTPEQLVAAMQAAAGGDVPPREPLWAAQDLQWARGEEQTADDVDRQLKVQILDLEDARDTGVYEDDTRAFGVNVQRRAGRRPGGAARWYNFGPQGYLECGMAGAFGGWDADDGVRIELDPSQVANLFADGADAPSEPAEIVRLTWFDVGMFLGCGAVYE